MRKVTIPTMADFSTVHGSASRMVLARLADGSQLTAAQLGTATGIPRSTVIHVLKRLAESGEVKELGVGPQQRGRPSRRWSISSPPGPGVVVVGGAHGITVGVVAADGTVLSVVEDGPLEVTPDGFAAGRAMSHVEQMLAAASVRPADLSMAVVGLPGPSSFSGDVGDGVTADHPPSGHLRRFRTWDGTSPVTLLRDHLGCPVYSENDVNLAALGEATAGVATGLPAALHVGLAHGTGAGLVIEGRLHRGHSGLAGEIGHLHSDDGGRLCHCGSHGCFWQTRSIPALLESLADAHGRAFSITDVAEAAAREDADVERALLGFSEALGRRLADAVVFIDPGAIVIDGSLGAASATIADGVRDALRHCAPPGLSRNTQVLVGELGIRAPLLGAVALARSENLFSSTAAPVPMVRGR
jgi:predicted NBD/HSP70 family sugar kinase